MQGQLRLSDEQFHAVYQRAFESWTRLHLRIINDPGLPSLALFPTISQSHPTLPRTLDLTHDSEGVFATGSSTWTFAKASCFSDLPPFVQSLRMPVSARRPNLLVISKNDERRRTCLQLTGSDGCYLSILILAWSYILSARWTETVPESGTLAYTRVKSVQVPGTQESSTDGSTTEIFLENAEHEEARWRTAVLAPGQGWEAQTQCQGMKYMSPWSVNLRSDEKFVLRYTAGDVPLFESALSFSEARNYLDKLCTRRNIVHQSKAALSAVLLTPSMCSPQGFSLPFPHVDESGHFCSSEAPGLSKSPDLDYDWTRDSCQIDKLLTVSCNVRGIRPMLLSTFFEPSIECNAVTPWLQETLTAIEHLGRSSSYWICRMFMERAPAIALLWLGVFVLDVHQRVLQDLRFGQIPIDLHSAAWSRTIQSSIQDRLSVPLSKNGSVSRADECRLLFLSQSGTHARLPLCQWKPFGTTAIEYTDIEIRKHQACEYHQLRYEGLSWKCQGATDEFQSSTPSHDDAKITKRSSGVESCDSMDAVPIRFEGMNRQREASSENATRNIFGWLRPDGCAPNEAELWKHERFELSGSDEDETSDEQRTHW